MLSVTSISLYFEGERSKQNPVSFYIKSGNKEEDFHIKK